MTDGKQRGAVTGDILIIDDKPANLQLLSSILKDRGHEVRAVVSGSMGLVAAQAVRPDLILLDVKMPDMDGYQVCRALKDDPALCTVPVIFISALGETLDKVHAFQLGAVDYITKPFQMEEVIARVEAHLALYFTQQRAQELAALHERQRLARDLHDAVSQTLFSASVSAETLLLQHEAAPDQVEPGLRQIHQLTQAALAEMRILLIELRPEMLAKADLTQLLTQLSNIVQTRTRADISLAIEDGAPLPVDVRTAFYRVAQEALNNVVKHAQAAAIEIDFHSAPGCGRLAIIDDGQGFSADDVPPGHFGLFNMRERAEAIGAALLIDSAPGTGTAVVLTWPAGGEGTAR